MDAFWTWALAHPCVVYAASFVAGFGITAALTYLVLHWAFVPAIGRKR